MFESTDIVLRHLISHLTVTARCFACKTRRRLRQFSTLEKPFCKTSLFLFECYFCKSFWQSNKKSVIYFQIPLNPSVRRVRRVYTLILNFTYNHAMHFSTKTINPTCQCFLLVTFLSRKKSNTHPTRPRIPSRAYIFSTILSIWGRVNISLRPQKRQQTSSSSGLPSFFCSSSIS